MAAKMLRLLVACAFLLTNVLAACPDTTGNGGGIAFEHGTTDRFPCPNTASQYTITCRGELWDHSGKSSACGTVVQPPPFIIDTPPSPYPVIIDTPPPPYPTIGTGPGPVPTGGNCQYLPNFMRPEQARQSFENGRTYTQMRCPDGNGIFTATCRDGAWVYPREVCTGQPIQPIDPVNPVQPVDPYIPQPGPSVNPQGGIFSGLIEGFRNLFGNMFGGPDHGGEYQGGYASCPPDPAVLDPNEPPTYHGRRREIQCPPGSQRTYYHAECNNGHWALNPDDCQYPQSTGIFGNIFGNSGTGGNLFNNQNFPWWILFLDRDND